MCIRDRQKGCENEMGLVGVVNFEDRIKLRLGSDCVQRWRALSSTVERSRCLSFNYSESTASQKWICSSSQLVLIFRIGFVKLL